jgi:hypothetical protein
MTNPTQNRSLISPVTIITMLVLLFGTRGTGLADYSYQDESKVYPDFNFSCIQNDHEFILKTRLSYWKDERDASISGAEVVFYTGAGEEVRQIAAVATNMNGEAEFRIEKASEKLLNLDGNFSFRAEFGGNQEYEMAEDMVEVRPLNLHLEFIEVDSVKTIVAEASETDQEGNIIPLEATDIYFYVPRSFSLLPVGDGWFEEGKAQLEFPTSLPGDSIGNLTILARIEDHELYGNVEAVGLKDWGLARPPVVVMKRRGLGDTDAPLWMVYTLIVLLSIVWFHYLYVFYLMIKIKKLRRNQEVNYDTTGK